MELGALLPLLLLVVVFWFLIMRPARKRQQEQRATIAALAPGRQVMTASGLFGTVTSVGTERVEIEIADGVRVEFLPAAILQVVPEPGRESMDSTDSTESMDSMDSMDAVDVTDAAGPDSGAGTPAGSGSSDATEGDTPQR